jgi:hypothetical protein
MKDKKTMLLEVKAELERFQKRLDMAIEDPQVNSWGPSSKFATCKRAAMDLKKELTKITQSSKYLYG